MHEELHALLPLIESIERIEIAGRHSLVGFLRAHRRAWLSGIGKIAAAATASLLLDRFAASELFFTGSPAVCRRRGR
jgi:adenosylhomocysteine nucleosidase